MSQLYKFLSSIESLPIRIPFFNFSSFLFDLFISIVASSVALRFSDCAVGYVRQHRKLTYVSLLSAGRLYSAVFLSFASLVSSDGLDSGARSPPIKTFEPVSALTNR